VTEQEYERFGIETRLRWLNGAAFAVFAALFLLVAGLLVWICIASTVPTVLNMPAGDCGVQHLQIRLVSPNVRCQADSARLDSTIRTVTRDELKKEMRRKILQTPDYVLSHRSYPFSE